MDYMAAWREGHTEGMDLVLKLINDLSKSKFNSIPEIIVLINQIKAASHDQS